MNYEASFSRGGDALELDGDARQRNRRRLIIGAVVAIAVIIGAVAFFSRNKGAAKPVQNDQQVPTVTVFAPGRQPVERQIAATGSLAARVDMPVAVVGEGGMVSRVLVQPGQWVRNGEVLATIERSVQTQQIAQQAASLNVARADARIAQANLDRSQQLVGRGFISKASVDQLVATRDAAVARVRVSEAQLAEMRARTGRLDIRAPAAGLILTRSVEPGQVVQAGSGTLFRMAKDGEMELRAQLSESDLASLHVGVPASITPVGTTKSFAGKVWQISPVIDPSTRQGIARIAVPYNVDLRPGGFAQAAIIGGTATVPLIPDSAVQSDEKGSFVFVVDKNNKAQRRDIKVGDVTDKGVAVIGGLDGTEHVVLSAGGFLSAGEAVKPELRKAF